MHKHILSKEQVDLLPFLTSFKSDYFLAGGTAIALHLGHRKSIDFDMFTLGSIDKEAIDLEIRESHITLNAVLVSTPTEYTIAINSVKCTFLHYNHSVQAIETFDDSLRLPSLLDLAATKAFTVGRRIAFKDYIDLYFLLRGHFTIQQVISRAKEIYGDFFNERLFREQLSYYEDVDTSEQIDFLMPFNLLEMGKFLERVAVS